MDYPLNTVELLEGLITCDNINTLIENGFLYLQHEFVFLDSRFHILGEYNFESSPSTSNALARLEVLLPLHEHSDCHIIRPGINAVYLLERTIDTDCNGLFCHFLADDKTVGYLIIRYNSSSITLNDLNRASIFCSLLSKTLLSFRVRHTMKDSSEQLILRLLDDRHFNGITLDKEAKNMGWIVGKNIYVFAAVPDSNYATAEPPFLLGEKLCAILPNAISGYYHKHLVVVFSSNNPLYQSDKIWRKVEALLQDFQFIGSISRPYTELYNTGKYYGQCSHTLHLVRELNISTRLNFFSDYNFQAIFSMIPDKEFLRQIILPDIYTLIQYDQENQSDLFLTLRSYIDALGDYTKVANQLFVHRNTIKYRISRAEELLKVDFSNSRDFYNLFLSISIMDYLDGKI